jgi:thiamine kinase-like enzyme
LTTLATWPMQLETIRLLLMPAEQSLRGTFIEADERWNIPEEFLDDTDAVIWGRAPLRSSRPRLAVTRAAVARERAIRRLRRRPPRQFSASTIHRLPPPSMRTSSGRSRLSAALRGGALVELAASERNPRVLDVVAEAAGVTQRLTHFTRGAGGALIFRISGSDSSELILRVGREGASDDPARGGEALARLQSSGLDVVPALIRQGHISGASWTVESALPGERPKRLSPQLAKQVAALCAKFPRSSDPPGAAALQLAEIARFVPQWSTALDRISKEVLETLSPLPGVLCHGDLWTSNLLVQGGRLTGLVDWDSWHEDGAPGTDLLNLVAVHMQVQERQEIGEIWLERPWRSSMFTQMTTPYWETFAVRPTREVLEAIGVAWWAARIAAIVSRSPAILDVDGWSRRNIDRVLSGVSSS